MGLVYLNGDFVPVEQAKVSVLDRGFLFGDGVYEVIPVFSGRPLQQKEHLDRLYRSLSAIDLHIAQSHDDWRRIFCELLALNRDSGTHQTIYLQITRGASSGRAHAYPDTCSTHHLCHDHAISAFDWIQVVSSTRHRAGRLPLPTGAGSAAISKVSPCWGTLCPIRRPKMPGYPRLSRLISRAG